MNVFLFSSLYNDCILLLLDKLFRHEGAILIDNLEIKGITTISNATASGEAAVAIAEFKIAINAYLKSLVGSSVRSLTDIIAFNNKFSDLVTTRFIKTLTLLVFQVFSLKSYG